MEETFVREKVREWLDSCHDLAIVTTPGPDVVGANMQFDTKGQQPLFRDVRVECKGTSADMDKAIGQTLRYFCEKPHEKIYI